MQSFTFGMTPEATIEEALPHKYHAELNREDMLTIIAALDALYNSESSAGYAVERIENAASLRSSILTTIGIEEI